MGNVCFFHTCVPPPMSPPEVELSLSQLISLELFDDLGNCFTGRLQSNEDVNQYMY